MAHLNSVIKWVEIQSDVSLKVCCNPLFTKKLGMEQPFLLSHVTLFCKDLMKT